MRKTASWGWWAGGLIAGVALASFAHVITGSAGGAATLPADRKAIEAIVKETILANPELIPEAITRLQQREVEKLLESNRAVIETPFAGAWAGARDGDVVLVEFFDFNCPFCRQSARDVDRLLAEDKGLKVVFRDMPVLGPESERFAMASLSAARQGRYRNFYNSVFAGQGALNQERLIRDVRTARLDEARVARDLNDRVLRAEVEKNLNLGRALGLTGTPSYVVGNRILSGAVGYAELKQAVADARGAGSSGGG
ncbi:MAG: DsbA family protein [Sandarakinorhabdus sp.]|nr:DsbA family protein [Sandarakinorhabdus sp.]